MDVPNHRSSHTQPTPRGGGMAIVLSFFMGVVALYLLGGVSLNNSVSILGAGLLIAGVGFIDDHIALAPKWRLLVQIVAALFGLYWLGGMPWISFTVWTLPSASVLGGMLALFYIVWMINLYNFMDGIDGLAAIEAITACCFAAFIYWLQAQFAMMLLPLALVACVAGFLCWNFPPARIFMGDGGSGFLGAVLAIFSIQAAWVDQHYFWMWLILLGVFIVDATVTLLYRAARGQKIHEAHCCHAYQQAASYFESHLCVITAVFLINACWLLPIGMLVGLGYVNGLLGLCLAYLPLIFLVIFFRAGRTALILDCKKERIPSEK